MFLNKTILIKNEDYTLNEEQKYLVASKFKDYIEMNIPPSGWGIEQMDKLVSDLRQFQNVVFASSNDYMIKELASKTNVYVFYNDDVSWYLI